MVGIDSDPTRVKELQIEQLEQEAEFLQLQGEKAAAEKAQKEADSLKAGSRASSGSLSSCQQLIMIAEMETDEPEVVTATTTTTAAQAKGKSDTTKGRKCLY